MKRYRIYQNPGGAREAVKLGWSWPAFIFSLFWAFAKKLYAVGAIVLIGGIVLAMVSWYASDLSRAGTDDTPRVVDHFTDLAGWAIVIVLAVNGNELREKRLVRLGYVLLGEVAARSVDEALVAYTEKEHTSRAEAG